LFRESRNQYPDIEVLHRPSSYSLLNYREELVRDILDICEFEDPPTYTIINPKVNASAFVTEHLPTFSEKRRGCKVCYVKTKKQNKVNTFCSAPQCGVYLHCTSNLNCFREWHSAEYHK